jgi:hypothetical protein
MRLRFEDYILDVARRELWRGCEPIGALLVFIPNGYTDFIEFNHSQFRRVIRASQACSKAVSNNA